ncbi:MAG: hypothetical protein IJ110_01410 [Lachnospiraceae bacterium]|nr:hypothetical protein [Lachnospiraceae bacterium]
MIEKVIRDYLEAKLDVPVYMNRPADPPDQYVLVMRTGGGGTHLYTSTFALQSIAPTLFEAVSLDDLVRTAMDAGSELPEISRTRLTNCYDYTNPATKQPRYQSIYEVIHY